MRPCGILNTFVSSDFCAILELDLERSRACLVEFSKWDQDKIAVLNEDVSKSRNTKNVALTF